MSDIDLEYGDQGWDKYQKLVLAMQKQHSEQLESIESKLAEVSKNQIQAFTKAEERDREIAYVVKVIREGTNGNEPLLVQISGHEKRLLNIEKYIVEKAEKEKSEDMWRKTSLISIFIAFISLLGQPLLNFLDHLLFKKG